MSAATFSVTGYALIRIIASATGGAKSKAISKVEISAPVSAVHSLMVFQEVLFMDDHSATNLYCLFSGIVPVATKCMS